jgi:hypothetical protein
MQKSTTDGGKTAGQALDMLGEATGILLSKFKISEVRNARFLDRRACRWFRRGSSLHIAGALGAGWTSLWVSDLVETEWHAEGLVAIRAGQSVESAIHVLDAGNRMSEEEVMAVLRRLAALERGED